MNPEFTHAEIIERLQTSFVIPFFQPGAGVHANWEGSTLTYRIDNDYNSAQEAAARQAFELWDDLIAINLNEVSTSGENIYFERNMSLGSLVRHIDPLLWAGGTLLGGLAGAGLVASGGAPALIAGTAFYSAAELTAGILAAVAAAGSIEPIKDTKIWFDSAFSPIKTDDWDFDLNDQTRIDWASVHIGDNFMAQIGNNRVAINNLVGIGEFGFETYMHEIGHALGLTHPGSYNADLPPRGDPLVYAQDTSRFTIMSYFMEDADGRDSWFGVRPATPMLHDVLAIQDKYGADPNTRTGDTVYGFNSTADRSVFDFTVNDSPVLTIYDAGGIDTLDTSGFADVQTIDLRVNRVGQSLDEERFSSIGGLVDNVAIAYGVTVENAVGGSNTDIIFGNDANNRLSGNGGADTLIGGDGDDTLDGGGGNDTMRGGADNDTYHVDSYLDVIDEARNDGVDEIITGLRTYTLPEPRSGGAYVENLTYEGRERFLGTGNALFNRITGGGNDDVLDGGTGSDTLVGRRGNDTYYVDNSRDSVVEAASEGIDTVHATVSLTLFANTENLILDGTAGINGTGNALDNTITGNTAGNVLDGAGGVDTLIGGGGNDTYVTDGGDTIVELFNQGTDLVRSSANYMLGANVENLTLTGTASIKGVGNALNNVITANSGGNELYGHDGSDTLAGGGGADKLYGGTGSDTLTGGGGTDTFHFDTALDPLKNVDRIVDFNVVDDQIALHRSIFTALTTGGVLSPDAFYRGQAAHDASDRIIYNPGNGNLIYDSNGSAAGGATLFETMATNLQLSSSDFLVV